MVAYSVTMVRMANSVPDCGTNSTQTRGLRVALNLPMSFHFGISKTYNRILQHLYWYGLKNDVAK